MNPAKNASRLVPLGIALAAAALLAAAAYLGWWKPLVLASLRFSIEGAIKRSGLPINFESLDLRGVNTIVIRNLSIASLEDPDSAVIREARLSFSIPGLLAGRLDVIKSITSITLVQPQATFAVPRRKGRPLPLVPFLPRAGLRIKEGRILLRKAAAPPTLCAFSDIDLLLRQPRPADHEFRVRFTPPGSGKRSFGAHGTLRPDALDVSLDADEINLAALDPWLKPFDLPVRLPRGAFSSSLRLKLTRTPAAEPWSVLEAWGKLDLDGISIDRPALPFPVKELTGRIQFDGTEVSVSRMSFRMPEIAWTADGHVSDISSPVFNLDFRSDAFDLSQFARKAGGKGTLKVMLRGTCARPEIAVEPDLSDFAWNGLSLPVLRGRLWVLEKGRLIRLDPAVSVSGAGVLTVRGQTDTKSQASHYEWLFKPASQAVPAFDGSLDFNASRASFTGRSADEKWRFSGKAAGSKRSWLVSLSGKSGSGAGLLGEFTLPRDPAKRASGRADVSGAGMEDFYLQALHPALSEVRGALTARIDLKGSPADPVLDLAVGGERLSLRDFRLPASADIRVSRSGVRISSLKVSSFASGKASFPFDRGRAAASASFEDAPLSFIRLFAAGPDWSRRVGGGLSGDFEAVDFPANPRCSFKGSLRRFSWNGTEYGQVEAEITGGRGSVSAKRLALKGPAVAAEGSGTFGTADAGWRTEGSAMISYLKAGKTDVEAALRFKGKGGKGAGEIGADLKSVRLNGLVYPDARVSLKTGARGEIEARASWEDLFSSVAVLRGSGGGEISLTAAFTDLPLKAVAGFLSMPSPAEKVSGSVKLKGPRSLASLNSSLRWRTGEAGISGVVDTLKPGEFSLNLSMVEADLSGWLEALRTSSPPFARLPEIKGRLETRSLSLKRSKGALAANGWMTFKDLRIEDQDAGKGSFRMAQDGGTTEIEASLEGPFGNYTLYPTRITGAEKKRLEGSFSWKNAPAGKAVSSCEKAGITADWSDGHEAEIGVELSGLSINEESCERLSVRLRKTGDSYSISSPAEETWQAFGTVALKQGVLEVMPDERTAGSWLMIRKAGGPAAKVSGKWSLPGAPERVTFEGHLLPAAPVLMVLGMPPTKGAAEADLSWDASQDPPLSGRLSLIKGAWNEYEFDLLEGRLSGTPGRKLDFTGLKVRRSNEFSASGAGSIELFPERKIAFKLTVDRLVLSYLRPLGILSDSDVVAAGTLVLSGPPFDPQAKGSLVCAPGTVNPRTGFTILQLTEGRLDLEGREASLSASLNDIAGAPVLVSANARLSRLLPETFVLSISAPGPVKIDALPRLYRGTLRGDIRFEGKPGEPRVTGDLLLEEGRIKTPPAPGDGDPASLAYRLSWDLLVRFGGNVQYVVEPVEGAPLELARISPESRVKIRGKGEKFEVYGNVTADSGPLTLFLGKQIWKKEPKD